MKRETSHHKQSSDGTGTGAGTGAGTPGKYCWFCGAGTGVGTPGIGCGAVEGTGSMLGNCGYGGLDGIGVHVVG